ncbi:MAG: GNAT family N-acetyltransferase [Dermatophilaceae bacterium]
MTAPVAGRVQVRRLAPGSPEVGDWVRMRALAHVVDGRPGPPVCGLDAVGSLVADPPGARASDYVATVDGMAVGWLRMVLPDPASTPAVVESLVVHPGWRGRGVGRRLVDEAHRVGRAAGRTAATMAVPEERLAVAGAWGAVAGPGSRQVFQVLDIGPVAEDVPVPAGVEVVTWAAACPDAVAAEVCRLDGHADVGVLRALETMRRTRGRTARHTALLARGGGLLGYTSISFPASSPHDPEQGMTVVDPRARGRSYGALLKRLNTAGLLRERPWAQRIWTANDEENRPMASLNERLGFRPWQYRRVHEWSL